MSFGFKFGVGDAVYFKGIPGYVVQKFTVNKIKRVYDVNMIGPYNQYTIGASESSIIMRKVLLIEKKIKF